MKVWSGWKGQHFPESDWWHVTQKVELEKAIALCVVGLSVEDWRNQGRNQGGVHLAVAVQFHHDVGIICQCGPVSLQYRASNAKVLSVHQNANTWVLAMLINPIACSVRTGIVHAIDCRHIFGDAGNDLQDVGLFFITGYDNSKAQFGFTQSCDRGLGRTINALITNAGLVHNTDEHPHLPKTSSRGWFKLIGIMQQLVKHGVSQSFFQIR